jgi:hypothetical protein
MDARNLIVCCDGTGNIWGNGHDTNVVKLVRLLVKDDSQIVYYDPGVGTTDNFPPIGLWNEVKAFSGRVVGLAMAGGIYESIGQGYEFLVDNFREGDRVCVFGFSRGAFAARSIAGIVDQFGIVRPGAKAMVPLLVSMYFSRPGKRAGGTQKTRETFAADIRSNFCAPSGAAAGVYFVGVWDTVASVGLFGLRITTDANVRHKRYQHVRHAVALDETRWKYSPRLYRDEGPPVVPGQTFEQTWFTGCHSDVGGSYADAALANLTLRWIVEAASAPAVGLRFLQPASAIVGDPNGLAHDEAFAAPWWTLAGLCERFRPEGAVQDPSVAARHAGRSVWVPWWRRPIFWVLALTTAILALAPGLLYAWGVADFWPQVLAGLKLQVHPWRYLHDPTSVAATTAWSATLLDCVLIPWYVSLFALWTAHARHGLRYSAQSLVAARLDRWLSAWPLIILAAADLAENAGVFAGLNHEGAARLSACRWVAAFGAVKLTALAVFGLYLLGVWVLGTFTRRSAG